MKRAVWGVLLAVVFALAIAPEAEAQRKRRRKAKPAQPPVSAQISKSMSDLNWGMTRDEVLDYFSDRIKKRYRPKMAKARGAIEEDRLRYKMREEVKRLRQSVVEFRGRKTGWDVSFLRGEFTHNNGESLIVYNYSKSQNFFFFFNNRLWKWFRAYNSEVFEGFSFDAFAGKMQENFGKALLREGKVEGDPRTKRWLEWQDEKSRLRAIDETEFYGFYCLVFDEKTTLTRLPQLRTAKQSRRAEKHSMIEAVTSDVDDTDEDGNADIVDRITGKIRNRRDAPEEKKDKKKASTATSNSGSTGASRRSRSRARDDDDDEDFLEDL